MPSCFAQYKFCQYGDGFHSNEKRPIGGSVTFLCQSDLGLPMQLVILPLLVQLNGELIELSLNPATTLVSMTPAYNFLPLYKCVQDFCHLLKGTSMIIFCWISLLMRYRQRTHKVL